MTMTITIFGHSYYIRNGSRVHLIDQLTHSILIIKLLILQLKIVN